MRFILLQLALLLMPVFLVPASGEAAMYTFVDERGVRHFSNVPDDPRYRLKPQTKLNRPVAMVTRQLERRKFAQGRRGASSAYINRHIERAAAKHKVDPHLIKAIIRAESNFDPRAVSHIGAQGLMQLMPGTAREMRVNDPFDIAQNINGGTGYFSKLLHSYHGNIELSLAAYNAGPARVKPHGTIPRIPETMNYVARVMRYYRSYRGEIARISSVTVRNMVTLK